MKKIIFIRHAKSSWSSGVSRDYDRPLNKRGVRDAPFMAEKLSVMVPEIDGMIISPSKRTTETAVFFSESYGLTQDTLIKEASLYHGSLYDILDAVQGLPQDWKAVMLIAHNPGMTSVAEYFGLREVVNVPTCGITIVQSDTDDWARINNENSKVVAFEYPKKYIAD